MTTGLALAHLQDARLDLVPHAGGPGAADGAVETIEIGPDLVGEFFWFDVREVLAAGMYQSLLDGALTSHHHRGITEPAPVIVHPRHPGIDYYSVTYL